MREKEQEVVKQGTSAVIAAGREGKGGGGRGLLNAFHRKFQGRLVCAKC